MDVENVYPVIVQPSNTAAIFTQVKDAIDDANYSDTGDSDIWWWPVFTGWARRFFFPIVSFIYNLILTIALILIYLGVGLFRGANWIVTFRWFILFGLLGYAGTSAFVANYEFFSSYIRIGLEVIDDFILRGVAPIANDLWQLLIRNHCRTLNLFWSFLRCLYSESIDAVVIVFQNPEFYGLVTAGYVNTSLGPGFFDENVFGISWANFTDVNDKRDIMMLRSYMDENPEFAEYVQGRHKKNMEDFYREHLGERYQPQYLNNATIGFDFGWDPDNPSFPQVDGGDVYENFYFGVSAFLDFMFETGKFLMDCFCQVFSDTYSLILESIIVCAVDLQNDPTAPDNIQGYADLVDYYFWYFTQSGACAGDFFETFWDEIFLNFLKKIWQFVVNLVFQLPCVNFDSFGCFLGSLLDCIGIMDFEACFTATGQPCNGLSGDLLDECIEFECRDSGTGLVDFFECFGLTILEYIKEFLCPILELIADLCDDINIALETVLEEVEDAVNNAFDSIEDACDDLGSIFEIDEIFGSFSFGLPDAVCDLFDVGIVLSSVSVPCDNLNDSISDFCSAKKRNIEYRSEEYPGIRFDAEMMKEYIFGRIPESNENFDNQTCSATIDPEKLRNIDTCGGGAGEDLTFDERIYLRERAESFHRVYSSYFKGNGMPSRDEMIDRASETLRKDKIEYFLLYGGRGSGIPRREAMRRHELNMRKLNNKYGRYFSNENVDYDESMDEILEPMFEKKPLTRNEQKVRKIARRIRRVAKSYEWNDEAEYAEHYRHSSGNLSLVVMKFLSVFSTVKWNFEDGEFSFPTEREMHVHVKNIAPHVEISKAFLSFRRFMRSYNDHTRKNLDKYSLLKHGVSMDEPPSTRHKRMYVTHEERNEYVEVSKSLQNYRVGTIRGAFAHMEAVSKIMLAGFIAPRLIDHAVNELASKGPIYDAPIDHALSIFGKARNLRRGFDNAWTTRRITHREDDNGNIVEVQPPDVYNTYKLLFDLKEGKRYLEAKKRGDPNAYISPNNPLWQGVSKERADYMQKRYPTMTHPKFLPATADEGLERKIDLYERFPLQLSFLTAVQNPEMLLGGAAPLIFTEPVANIFGLWKNFAFRWFKNMFEKYLVFDIPTLKDIGLDTAETVLYNIIYGINVVTYYGIPLLLAVILAVMETIAQIVLVVISMVFPWIEVVTKFFQKFLEYYFLTYPTIVFFFFPSPPVPSVDDNGIPLQSPVLGYFNDIMQCNSTPGTCTTNADCAGSQPCICETDKTLEWRTYLWKVENTDPCVGNTGYCLCYPELQCDLRFPLIKVSEFITPECDKEFGYDFRNQVWYNPNEIIGVIKASYTNFIVQLKFLTRSFSAGWPAFLNRSQYGFLIAGIAFFFLVALRKPLWFFAILVAGFLLFELNQDITDFIFDTIIPFLEDLSNNNTFWVEWLRLDELAQQLLGWFQFPTGISPEFPAGKPDIAGGELTCFGIGLFTSVPGAIVFLGSVATAFLFLGTGAFWLLILLLLRLIFLLFLVLWSFVWAVFRCYRLESRYEDVADYVNRKVVFRKFREVVENIEDRTSIASMNARMNYWIPQVPTKKKLFEKITMLEDQIEQKDDIMHHIMGKISEIEERFAYRDNPPDERKYQMNTEEGQHVVQLYPSTGDYVSVDDTRETGYIGSGENGCDEENGEETSPLLHTSGSDEEDPSKKYK